MRWAAVDSQPAPLLISSFFRTMDLFSRRVTSPGAWSNFPPMPPEYGHLPWTHPPNSLVSHPQLSTPFEPCSGHLKRQTAFETDGDVGKIAIDWAPEEREMGRRLVHVTHVWRDSVIAATFDPVRPGEGAPDSTCVSCISWARKGGCYVTSFDVIRLSEALLSASFAVDEKKRIRRNLEQFGAVTVSEVKEDSEDFFRLIMSFPVPRPRNTERDLKVFPWSKLAEALAKIIGRYESRDIPRPPSRTCRSTSLTRSNLPATGVLPLLSLSESDASRHSSTG